MSKKSKDEMTFLENVLCCLTRSKVLEIKDVFEKKGIKEFLINDDLKSTLKILTENDLNVCKASKQMFMHRNTLLYRIQKIKKLTSYDIRIFDDAMTLQTILILYDFYAK